MWVRALCDPPHGLESTTEQEVEGLGGDAEALGAMLDALLQENSCLRGSVAAIDAERLAEACVGFGTDDKKLVTTICSRNKQHLGMVSRIYYAEHGRSLSNLIGSECSGWYASLTTRTSTMVHLRWYTYYGHLLWHGYLATLASWLYVLWLYLTSMVVYST